MVQRKVIETAVGLFMIVGIIALLLLAFKVSGLTSFTSNEHYTLYANFNNIGDLKVRAPVTVAGVRVGRVAAINLDKQTFQAHVTLSIEKKENNLPTDTSASILTEGLLGSNYIGLTPGFDETVLKNDGTIQMTHSALILENIVGQLLFSTHDKGKNKKVNS